MGMKNRDKQYLQTLLTEAQIAAAESTRYRDREWANVLTFTGAIVAIIAFAIANPSEARQDWWFVDGCLVALTVANIYYTCYAHMRLADMRVRLHKIRQLLGTCEIEGNNAKPPKGPKAGEEVSWRQEWWRGFGNHLVPFFLCDVALTLEGIVYIHRG